MRTSAFFCLAFLLFACTQRNANHSTKLGGTLIKLEDATSSKENWSKENTLIYHTISEPDNLHPTNGNSGPRSEILQYTQRTLLYTDYENQSVMAGLCDSLPRVSVDGKEFTFHLRKGIKWDDGSDLTTEDVLFSAKAYACPLTNDPAVKSYWDNVSEIKLNPADPNEITYVMKGKAIQNVSMHTGFYILERKFHDAENLLGSFTLQQFHDTNFHAEKLKAISDWATAFNDDLNGRDPKRMNGLGMYRVEKWEAGQFITLVKKPNHWTEQSHDYHEHAFPDRIIYKLNKDENSTQLEFKSGTIDVTTSLSVSSFMALMNNPEFKKDYPGVMSPLYNYTYIGMNEKPDSTRKPFFTDPKVREAMSYLVQVDSVISLIYRDYSSQCRRMISNVSPLKTEFNSSLQAIPNDISKAQKLLAEAGWNDSDKDGILDRMVAGQLTNFEVDLNYMNTSNDWKDMANLIAEQFKKGGIKVNPVPMELKVFIEKARAHSFDMMLGTWGGNSLPEDYTQLWHTKSWVSHGSNYCGFGSPESDALIDSLKGELNPARRKQLSAELQTMIYNDHPYVFLYSNLRRNIVHNRFANRMIFADRPGILLNSLRLLSINQGITLTNGTTP